MVIRNKSGGYWAEGKAGLLEFLGVKEGAGVQAVSGDVELIASVPFALAADGEADL